MWSYFVKGGIMMWPLLGCSILSLAIIIERLIFFYKTDVKIKPLMEGLLSSIKKDDIDRALKVCDNTKIPIVNTLRNGLMKFREGKETVRESMEEAGLYEIPRLERYLAVLQALASIATLMGFTGTVMGMIRAFNDIVAHGISSPTVVAKGIAEALITTVTGLFIAIPTLLFYHYFSHRVDKSIIEIEQCTRELLNLAK